MKASKSADRLAIAAVVANGKRVRLWGRGKTAVVVVRGMGDGAAIRKSRDRLGVTLADLGMPEPRCGGHEWADRGPDPQRRPQDVARFCRRCGLQQVL